MILLLLHTAKAIEKKDTATYIPTGGIPEKASFGTRYLQQISAEGRSEYIFPTNPFLEGANGMNKPVRYAQSGHLRYSFQSRQNTLIDYLYGGVYQGVGLGIYNMFCRYELGNPFAAYVFQGGRICRFNARLSLNYEWNFGISSGWKPYDEETNPNNIFIGSRLNAYMNAGFFLRWSVSPALSLTSGVTLNHFSNGNTKYPNGGLNSIGLKIGAIYNINPDVVISPLYPKTHIPYFKPFISYDVVFFGSWRRKGVDFMDKQVASPFKYKVFGLNIAAMYNFGYRFRAGLSIDGVYDESCGAYTEDFIVGTEQPFYTAPLKDQFGAGLSVRGEYVMPYFTIGIGLGGNICYKGQDMKGFYQILALKMELTRNSFLHVGYNLQNFRSPNYLMLGIGYRFNNKYPRIYR